LPIGPDEVQKIARLAGLELAAGDDAVARSLGSILEYVAALDELEVGDVPPTTLGALHGLHQRPDRVRAGLSVEEALRNAPESDGERFRVPGVFDG
jgi:aspartyl-tRNA(Asn)/glutamyl-tRNA(Gln) amidotransferase subunit C